jgi:hypothetical protein
VNPHLIQPNSQRFATLVHELVDMDDHLHALTGGMLLRGERDTEEYAAASAAYASVKRAVDALLPTVEHAVAHGTPVDVRDAVSALKQSKRALLLWAKTLTGVLKRCALTNTKPT